MLIDNHVFTECEESKDGFICSSQLMSKKRLNGYRDSQGGVFLRTGARLTYGLTAEVVSSGLREMEYKDGTLKEKSVVGAGVKKNLSIGRHAGANYSGNGPCTLSPIAGETDEWNLRCVGSGFENFRFADKTVHSKFSDLVEAANAEALRMSSFSQKRYLISVLAPLSGFVLLSGLVFFMRKLYLFVRFGARGKQSC